LREHEREQREHGDPEREQKEILQLLREHAARLARLEKHQRAELAAVRIRRRQPVQPQRQADRQETCEECGREQCHVKSSPTTWPASSCAPLSEQQIASERRV